MRHFPAVRKYLTLLAVSVVIGLAGCGRDDPSALVASARDYQAKGDHQAAIIQLKNVLQKEPQNGVARLLLGNSAMVIGDAQTAEKEYRKALEFGQPPSTVVPLIATAMLQGGGGEKVISEFSAKKLDDPRADAELKARVGEAQLSTRDPQQAARSFAEALASDPQNLRAQLGLVRLKASEGKLEEASSDLETVVAAHPASRDALLLSADLKLARGDRSGAQAVLQRAVELSPATPGPRLQLISLLISENQLDAATNQIAAARSARAPEVPLQYSEALVAYGKKDFARARELAQQVLKRAPGHVQSTVLLGAMDYQERRYAQAESQLQNAVTQAPGYTGARVLLARSYLASGKPSSAVEALSPVVGPGKSVDPQMLMLAGEAHFANGDVKQAAALFEQASQSRSQQPLAQTRLAQIAIVSGDLEGGVRKLEGVAAEEGAPVQTDIALLTGYLRQGETARALEVARGMIKKRPDDPMSHQALGSVLLVRKDVPAARAAFERAVELNPTYMPAVAALAQLDIQQSKPADARARFEAVLTKDPKNETALLGLAEMMARARTPSAEIIAVLKRAIAGNPGSVNARLALINLYLRDGDARAALTAAQEADANVGRNPRMLDALGRAQLAAGETNQAIETFNRLAAAEPRSTVPLMRLASAYSSLKEPDKVIDTLLRAQKLAPADPVLTRELAVAYLATGKTEQALKQAKALQAAVPKSAGGHVLEGDVHSASGQWPAAEKAYRDAAKLEPASGLIAIKLHGALLGSGKKAEADAFSRKWVGEHPQDVVYRGYLGEQALRARDMKGAAAHYEAVIAKQPDNAVALNNLAWALGQLDDPKAIGYAERALKLAPNSPAVLDTLGTLLSAKGDAAKAADYLARAVQLAPQRHEIRLNYAKALLKAGRTEEARKELSQLQSVTTDFPGKAEVADLLKK